MNKKRILRVLWAMTVIAAALSAGAYYYYSPDKPNMALYCLLAGGVIVFNFLAAIFLVNKNFKDRN